MRLRISLIAALLLGRCLAADARTITVAADGTGDFQTIQQAIAAVPDKSAERTVIHIKSGTYQGQIVVPKNKSNVTFEGEGSDKTKLTFAFNINEPNPPDIKKYNGIGVMILGDDFCADRITFQNTSGDHGQALALRIDGDRAIVTNCRIMGWQDTLRVERGRQYFRDCYIAGRVDFIYGSGTAVFDRCQIHSRNGGHVTAASTPQDQPYGLVFLDCKLTGDARPWTPPPPGPDSPKPRVTPLADLGRPWRPHGAVTFIRCEMGAHIKPEGWNNWNNPANEKTARYSEFNSTGPGANPTKRVVWSKQLTKEQANKITATSVLGGKDNWNPQSAAQ